MTGEKDVKFSYDFDIYCLLHDTLKITKQFDADIMTNKSIKGCMERLSGANQMALRRKVLETETFPQYLGRDESNGFVELKDLNLKTLVVLLMMMVFQSSYQET